MSSNRSKAAAATWQDPAVRARRSDGLKRSWNDPVVRNRREKANATPEVKRRRSKAMTEVMKSDATRRRIGRGVKRALYTRRLHQAQSQKSLTGVKRWEKAIALLDAEAELDRKGLL